MKKAFLLTTMCMTLFLSAIAQQDFSKVQIKTVPVKGNLYMLQGAGGNIGVLVGDGGVMMIDNQFAPLAPKIQAAIKELKDAPIKLVINTHLHGDHAGGNIPFAEAGGMIIAQENVRKRMSKEQVNEFFNRTTPPSPAEALPVMSFKEDFNFQFYDQHIEIHHLAAAHTDGDAIIFFKDLNAVHMGDVFVTYGFPFVDSYSGGSINGFVNYLDQALTLMDDETIVIPGHGNLSKKSDVQKFRDTLAKIRDKVVAGHKSGKSVDQILEGKPTAEFEASWGGGFISGEDFVKLIYLSLSNPDK